MLLKIDTVGDFYTQSDTDKLKKLGFEFKSFGGGYQKTKEGVLRNFETVEDLLVFAKEYSTSGDIILTEDTVVLFDDYAS